MPRLTIPESDQAGLIAIKRLDDADVDLLAGSLRVAPEPRTPGELERDLEASISSRLAKLKPRDVKNVVTALVSLYFLRSQLDQSIMPLVSDIADAMERSPDEDLRISEVDREELENKLVRLLEVEELFRIVRGQDLATNYERVFLDARILTDIRPVFGPDPSAPPSTAVIVHTLKITQQVGTDVENIYIAMDSADLDELQKVIDRARNKAASLEIVLQSIRKGG